MAPTENWEGLLADDDDLPQLPTKERTSSHYWEKGSEQRQDTLPGENFNTPMQQMPPHYANFQCHTGVNSSNIYTNGNGDINVDNIFASMSEEESIFNHASTVYNTTNSNSIFHNFANMNQNTTTTTQQQQQQHHRVIPLLTQLPSTDTDRIPIRKYSDCTNNFSRGRAATTRTLNVSPTTSAPKSESRSNIQRLSRLRSDGDVLSKSMGTRSFFPRLGHRNPNESDLNTTLTIRHGGYLLKRSNLPYTTMPMDSNASSSVMFTTLTASSVTNDAGTGLIVGPVGAIAPLPDLADEIDDNLDRVFPLPLASRHGDSDKRGNSGGAESMMFIMERESEKGPPSSTEVRAASWNNFLDSPPSMVDNDDGGIIATSEVCFCAPILDFMKQIIRIKQPTTVVAGNAAGDKLTHERRVEPFEGTRVSPSKPQTVLPPNAASVNQYEMLLKSPARSDPVPIASAGFPKMNVLPRNLSSTFTRTPSAILPRQLSSSKSMSILPNKEILLPPPPDYIDPKDGHIWRSKYCILEEGILYFYRTAAEGESAEAEAERYESRLYSEELEDIVLGEEVVISSPSRNSGGRAVDAPPGHDNMISRDIYDLSKSPMPRNKSDMMFNLRQGSSTSVLTASVGESKRPIMLHSNSTSTFHNETDILWEKRVALNCVGAVRSSEQEHGTNTFELIAHDEGTDQQYGGRNDDDVSASVDKGGGKNDGINNRLILRAGSSDERNAWMFQFHRSLTSFLMQKIVKSVRNGSTGFTGRGTPPFGVRSDSLSFTSQYHRRLPCGGTPDKGGSISSPFVAISSFASSPNGNNSFGGNGFSSNFVGSLSHGHGRNALYRRQVRDGKSVGGISSALSPLPTPAARLLEGSSPIDANDLASSMIIQSESSANQKKIDLACLRDLRIGGENEDVLNLRDSSTLEAPKKYIPPHMRKTLRRESNGASFPNDTSEEQVPLKDGAKKPNTFSSMESGNESLSDSAFSVASSSLSIQLEDPAESISVSINVRLGGCADPNVVVGSIIDDFYIDRKASVVGNARLEAYGGTGGGYFSVPFNTRSYQVRDEDESIVLDDLDVHRPKMLSDHSCKSVLKWEVGASSECGVRNTNEDSYVVINNLDELIQSQGLFSFSQQDLGQTKQQGLYAIFDGHVGNQAARFSAEMFPDILMEEQSALASRDSACLSSIEERANTVLSEAFVRLDREFCSLCTKDGRDWDCGSTALVALIVDDVVSLANLGDCRGVVCRLVSDDNGVEEEDVWEALDSQDDDYFCDRANGWGNGRISSRGKLIWKELTSTHSPLFEEERARIDRANGWIIHETEIPISQLHRMDIFDEDVVEIVKRCFADRMKQHRSDPVRQIQIARTCGDLAVSRAIGDRDFKAAYNIPSNKITTDKTEQLGTSWEGPLVFIYPDGHSGRFKGDIVSNVPDIQFFKVRKEPTILLMACDGLWDVMDGDDAVRIATDLLFDKKLSAKDGAARLTELAQHLGSSDNITVILIRFYWEDSNE